jgi:hypothetical protein
MDRASDFGSEYWRGEIPPGASFRNLKISRVPWVIPLFARFI